MSIDSQDNKICYHFSVAGLIMPVLNVNFDIWCAADFIQRVAE
jgi:hypothetical protein